MEMGVTNHVMRPAIGMKYGSRVNTDSRDAHELALCLDRYINRGDRREPIFLCEKDRELFLQILGETCARTSSQVHAWCLMPNHFRLVVETPRSQYISVSTAAYPSRRQAIFLLNCNS